MQPPCPLMAAITAATSLCAARPGRCVRPSLPAPRRQRAVLKAFDLLELNGEDIQLPPFEKRKAKLQVCWLASTSGLPSASTLRPCPMVGHWEMAVEEWGMSTHETGLKYSEVSWTAIPEIPGPG
jgi:hypothetical protein